MNTKPNTTIHYFKNLYTVSVPAFAGPCFIRLTQVLDSVFRKQSNMIIITEKKIFLHLKMSNILGGPIFRNIWGRGNKETINSEQR